MSPAGEPPCAASPAMKKCPPWAPLTLTTASVTPAGTTKTADATALHVQVSEPEPDKSPLAPQFGPDTAWATLALALMNRPGTTVASTSNALARTDAFIFMWSTISSAPGSHRGRIKGL